MALSASEILNHLDITPEYFAMKTGFSIKHILICLKKDSLPPHAMAILKQEVYEYTAKRLLKPSEGQNYEGHHPQSETIRVH